MPFRPMRRSDDAYIIHLHGTVLLYAPGAHRRMVGGAYYLDARDLGALHAQGKRQHGAFQGCNVSLQ